MRALASALLATVMSFSAAHAAAAEGEAARFRYEGFMGGIKIGWAEADVASTDQRYVAKLKMETGGLVGWFVEWRHGSEAVGKTTRAAATPLTGDHYRNDNFWKEKERFVEVAYKNGMAEIVEATPHPVKDEGRPEVPANLRVNVIDPVSAIFAVGRELERTGKCDASFGVFDGRRRYQLKMTDKGDVDLGRSRYAPFGGEARRCDFVFERVAGFKNKDSDDPTRGRAYFRRAKEGAPMMPVQVAADMKYGAAILHLQEVELLDPKLAEQAAVPRAGGARAAMPE